MRTSKAKAGDSAQGVVKSAGRVLDLLELLGRWDREMGHADIADALGIPKSSLTQLLKDLVTRGYVDFAPATKGYRLGASFAALAWHAGRSRDLVRSAESFLTEITAATQESSALNRIKDMQAEVAATVSGPQRLVTHMRLGDLAPLYATSGGKAILAYLPEVQREEYLTAIRFQPITPNTIASVAELRRQIATVRKEGVAYSFEEFTPGIVGIGVPILSESGLALGSLNVAMPSVRYNSEARDRAIDALECAARGISRRIAPPPPGA
jgi:DNA-binding IclR family transcriptional regulator